MITSFRHKGLARYYWQHDRAAIPATFVHRIFRILNHLDTCATPESMNVPGNRYHQLKGNRQGTYSIHVTGNWRITFQFEEGNALNVDLEDYH